MLPPNRGLQAARRPGAIISHGAGAATLGLPNDKHIHADFINVQRLPQAVHFNVEQPVMKRFLECLLGSDVRGLITSQGGVY